ncbi:MAG TPA: NAD-dependent epimerase/dehydratase family protein [Gemmataceae bacterium]|jgi:dihydroflavonol-4-reductase
MNAPTCHDRLRTEPRREFWKGLPVCVLGGTGFLGSHLIERLLHHGARVRDLSLPMSDSRAVRHSGMEYRVGDVRNAADVRGAVAGARVVFLAAGSVAIGHMARSSLEAHRDGVRRVLDAISDDTRLVLTSSVVAVGATRGPQTLDESASFTLDRLKVGYVHAKRAAEVEALSAAASGRDVVVVNPGYLFGPVDPGPSVMGRYCLRVWRGKIPFVAKGGINAVDVRDVAAGHLLAAERGLSGRRYILGGENLTNQEVAAVLVRAAGRQRHFPRVPHWAFAGLAAACEVHGRFMGKEPFPSMETARVGRLYWHFSSDRAKRELGYRPRPFSQTAADAFAWHQAHTRVTPRGLNRWLFPATRVRTAV